MRPFLSRVSWVMLAATVAFLGLSPILPTVSGMLSPQVRDFVFVTVDPVEGDPFRTRVTFTFTKSQRDCAFLGPRDGVEWWRGTPATGARAQFLPAPDSPDLGAVDVDGGEARRSAGWIVDLPADVLLEGSTGYWIFQCHPFWRNRTKVWPPH